MKAIEMGNPKEVEMLLEDGVYYLYLNGFWQVARPEEIKAGHGNLQHHALINL